LQGHNVISDTTEFLEATSALVIPLLQRVNLASNECQALVLVSSRELARNLVLVIRSYLDGPVQLGDTAPPSVNCYAWLGVNLIQEETAMLRKEGCQIIVSTPGRALDLIHRRVISMNSLKMICLRDIGDMLNRQFGSFIEDVIKSPELPDTIQVIATSYGTFDEREFLEELVGDLICIRRVQLELWDGCC
jgi:ATP-dependent RNA helicase DeaD